MFRSPAKRATASLQPEKFDTILGPQTEVTGHLSVSESIRIDGKLIGNVCAAQDSQVTVVVGSHGLVVGNVGARRVVVAGRIQGSIEAQDEVELHSGSVVEGDVSCASVSIAHGAKVLGRMTASHERTPTPTIEAVTPAIGTKKKVELVA